jgi:hypothetical protein
MISFGENHHFVLVIAAAPVRLAAPGGPLDEYRERLANLPGHLPFLMPVLQRDDLT